MRTKNNETKLIQLINGIMNDEIKEEDVYTEDEYYKILIDNNTLIRNTLKLQQERKASKRTLKAINDSHNKKLNKIVLFITSEVGDGKSYFTDILTKIIKDRTDFKWDIYEIMSEEPFSQHKGEEISILDFITDENILKPKEWAYLTKQNTTPYINKTLVTSRVIIIVSVPPVEEFVKRLTIKNKQDVKYIQKFINNITYEIKVNKNKDDNKRNIDINTFKHNNDMNKIEYDTKKCIKNMEYHKALMRIAREVITDEGKE